MVEEHAPHFVPFGDCRFGKQVSGIARLMLVRTFVDYDSEFHFQRPF
jgi:hypothetical protein